MKLGQRKSDSAPVAFLEWVDAALLIDQEIDDSAEKKARKPKKEDGQDAGAEKNTKKKAVAAAT